MVQPYVHQLDPASPRTSGIAPLHMMPAAHMATPHAPPPPLVPPPPHSPVASHVPPSHAVPPHVPTPQKQHQHHPELNVVLQYAEQHRAAAAATAAAAIDISEGQAVANTLEASRVARTPASRPAQSPLPHAHLSAWQNGAAGVPGVMPAVPPTPTAGLFPTATALAPPPLAAPPPAADAPPQPSAELYYGGQQLQQQQQQQQQQHGTPMQADIPRPLQPGTIDLAAVLSAAAAVASPSGRPQVASEQRLGYVAPSPMRPMPMLQPLVAGAASPGFTPAQTHVTHLAIDAAVANRGAASLTGGECGWCGGGAPSDAPVAMDGGCSGAVAPSAAEMAATEANIMLGSAATAHVVAAEMDAAVAERAELAAERHAWHEERAALLARVDAAEAASSRMQHAAAMWKEEHAKLEAAAEEVAKGETNGARSAAATLLEARDKCDQLERALKQADDARRQALIDLDSEKAAARAASDDLSAQLDALKSSLVSSESASRQAVLNQHTDLAVSHTLLQQASGCVEDFTSQASAALSSILNGGAHLRMAWADVEQRDTFAKQAAEANAAEERLLIAERARLATLAAEKEAVVQGQKALRGAQQTLRDEAAELEAAVEVREAAAAVREAQAAQREADAEARELAASQHDAAAAEREAAAAVSVEQAAEEAAHLRSMLAEVERALRAAEERAEERESGMKRESRIEVEEMHAAMLEEAVGGAALSKELDTVERAHHAHIAELTRAHQRSMLEAQGEARDALDLANAKTSEATREHAHLQVAAEEAHALCEAFDAQLRDASRELTEREVYVCMLLAELRADDVAHASAAAMANAKSRAPPLPQHPQHPQHAQHAQQPPPHQRPSCIPTPTASAPHHKAGSHLGAAARARRDEFTASSRPQGAGSDEGASAADGPAEARAAEAAALHAHQQHQVLASSQQQHMAWGEVPPMPPAAACHGASTPTAQSFLKSSGVGGFTPGLYSAASTMPPTAPPPPSVAWEVPKLQHELQAALDAAAAAQRSAAAAEEMAAQQQASHALNMRREREKMRAEHQAEVAKVWAQIAEIQSEGPGE